MALDPRYVSPKERKLFLIGAVLSGLTWLAVVVSLIGIVYAAFGALFVLSAHALFLAHVRTNGVRIDERQLPELHARVRAAASRLGIDPPPEIYVLNGGGVLNAFATKLLSRRYVILLSDLVDGCSDPRQLDFVIGHELGHFAAGHLKWNVFLLPYRLVPWAGAAYSRACEYTCDRCGLAAAGDLEQAQRGLVVLAAGGKIAARADLGAFASQRLEAGGFWATVLELTSFHPFLCKRAGALQELNAPGTVPEVRRSVAGWILAPFLGSMGGAGGGAPIVAIAIVGMLAAIAIPNFIKYQLRSKEQGGKAALEALHEAQLALHERTKKFSDFHLPAKGVPGAAPLAWTEEDQAIASELGWKAAPSGYHSYTVAVGRNRKGKLAYAACAESDLDGDGVYAAWMVWHPVDDGQGNLVAPDAPCQLEPKLARPPVFQASDLPGVAVKVSPPDVF
jgi:Zn-dependent protease with chaperone function